MAAKKKKTVATQKKTGATAQPARPQRGKASSAPALDVEARAEALPSEQAEQNPYTSVSQTVAYALRTAEVGRSAAAQLAALPNFDFTHFEALLPGAVLLQNSESRWNAARARSRAGVSPQRVKAAEARKDEFMEVGRYILRDVPEAQEELDQIAAGSGVADLSLDLSRLADLAQRYPNEFAAAGLDAASVAAARSTAHELGKGIAPEGAAELQAARNRAFHQLDRDIAESVAALRFIWRKHPTKISELGIRYASQLRRLTRGKRKSAPAPVPA